MNLNRKRPWDIRNLWSVIEGHEEEIPLILSAKKFYLFLMDNLIKGGVPRTVL